jgi:flagellar hook-basal body complex protein FliE
MSGIDAGSVMALRSAVIQRSDALKNVARAQAPEATEFKQLLGAVNAAQREAGAASAAYERGETSDIAGVMLARQKSSIAFEATLQVRNKLLSAYRDIMNMPV